MEKREELPSSSQFPVPSEEEGGVSVRAVGLTFTKYQVGVGFKGVDETCEIVSL